jgi:acetoin utilization deacetylase AcuC-like enzyme
MTETILPAVRDFDPDIILISGGFDAHRADPLAILNFETEDYAWVTTELVAVANDCCGGRLVSTLEGGYDLRALADSAAAHVRSLMTG